MRKAAVYIILFLILPQVSRGQSYHPLCFRDSLDYGSNITRTLALLATSTKDDPHDVNIIVYGQSVSKQDWWMYLEKGLKQKFPYARIHMVNRSVGGFASQKLWKTTAYDILPFYPDLVIFHVFGSHIDYEKILQMIRGRTSAEMLVWNDPWAGPDAWADTMSFHIIPSFCDKYKLEFADVRSKWIRYLEEQHMDGSELRHDGVHLNDAGNRLLAGMLLPYFNYNPGREADPYHLVDTIVPASPLAAGKLDMQFTGNRIDLYLDRPGDDTVKARVLIDNHLPSSLREIFHITRPNADPGMDWPWQTGAVIHTTSIAPLIPETWTIKMTETGDSLKWFRFKIYGSLTGYDGSGISSKKFISNSGRVIIEPEDWFIKPAWDMFKVNFQPGYTITWDVKSIYSDYIDNADILKYTLFQGIRNESHTLELIPYHQDIIPVRKIIIYKPFLISQ